MDHATAAILPQAASSALVHHFSEAIQFRLQPPGSAGVAPALADLALPVGPSE